MNRRNIMIILSVLAFVIIIGGVSYSYFVYNKDIGTVTLNTGDISIDLSGINGNKTLTNVVPLFDIDGKTTSDYFDFTVNSTVDTEKIYYEVYLLPKNTNTLDTSYLKVYLTDQSDNQINGVRLYNSLKESTKENGKVIYQGVVELNNDYTSKNESKDFRLRLWLDESYTEQTSKTFEFDIYLYAKNVPEDFEIPIGVNMVRKAIEAKKTAETNSCNPVFIDDLDTEDTTDDITYFSGTNDCVDMNYVWYSGKLWRITAIYPDGSMKLVTQNNITSIAFNESDVNFYTDANTTSYMYQWLNEDFYDTLYNAENIIDTTKEWDMGTTSTISSKPSESVNISANVGLLNSYEYYNSYRCIGSSVCTGSSYSTGYLNIGYYWWLLNPYSASDVWNVMNTGYGYSTGPTTSFGTRPSIYLKSGVEFTGNGTSTNPYKIVGDKDAGQENELINTRLSGEYVKLDNGITSQKFRIIGVENNKTKIIAMDYADNGETKGFATSTGSANTLWGSGTTIGEGTWYTYLNTSTTGYFDILKSTYGDLFDSGVYQLGTSGYNYKNSICSDPVPKEGNECAKEFNIGLPRYGEMFATQEAGGYSNSKDMWLMNRYSASDIWFVMGNGSGNHVYSPTASSGTRPSIYLKSGVKIISGKGLSDDPYIVGISSS